MTSPASNEASSQPMRPEFVPLPTRGGDSVCGLSRSWWYGAERQGRIRLARPRLRGKMRGRVLLPVTDAIALVRSLGIGRREHVPPEEDFLL